MSAACERQIAGFGRLRKKLTLIDPAKRGNGRPQEVSPAGGAGGARLRWWGTGGRVLPSHAQRNPATRQLVPSEKLWQ